MARAVPPRLLGLLSLCLLAGCSSAGAPAKTPPSATASSVAITGPSCQAGSHPPARFGAAMAYDAARKSLVLFSGIRGDGSAPLADTWTWDGCQWTSHATAGAPPGRSFGAMAYDPGHTNVVLFGGGSTGSDNFRNDTWTWDGQSWTERHPTTAPPTMSAADLEYDRANAAVVLVGQSLRGEATALWTWDGQTWKEKQPAHTPDPRSGAATAYGAKSGVLYFGGTSGFGDPLSDLWVWDGSDWGRLTPKRGPAGGPARMARDDARKVVLLLEEDGTWTWDGTAWTHAQPQTAPPDELFRAIAYDGSTRQIVVFGGKSPQSNVGTDETWVWDGASWTHR